MTLLSQIWLDFGCGADPPPETAERSESFKAQPGFTYKLWKDADIDRLLDDVEPSFPDVRLVFGSLPWPINRADFVRYVVLFLYGGAYFDLDFVLVRPLDPVLMDDVVVLSEEWPHSLVTGSVHNGALACKTPRHPFWLHVMREVRRRLGEKTNVFTLTGTGMLRDAVCSFQAARGFKVVVGPFGLFCPLQTRTGVVIESYHEYRRSESALADLCLPTHPGGQGHSLTVLCSASKTWQTVTPGYGSGKDPGHRTTDAGPGLVGEELEPVE